jgi:signal peptidase
VFVSHDYFSVITKGDANESIDPYRIPVDSIVGMHLFSIPRLGFFVNFVQSRTGWFLCILLPTFLLVVWIVIEILKEAFRKPDRKQVLVANHDHGNISQRNPF